MTMLPRDVNNAPIQALQPSTTQTVAIGVGSLQSTAIPSGVSVVRIYASSLCHIDVGANPTATTATMPVAAGVAEYIAVKEGQKVAVIQNAAAGTLWITEMGDF